MTPHSGSKVSLEDEASKASSPTKYRTLHGWWFSSTLLLLLSGVFPLLFTQIELGSLSEPPVLLAFVVTQWASLKLTHLLGQGQANLVQTTFWVFVYIWFGLAGLAQTAAQQFPIANQTFTEGTQVNALLTVIMGLVAYEIGRVTYRSLSCSSMARQLERLQLSRRRILSLSGLAFASVVVAVWTYGLSVFFTSRYSVAEALYGQPGPGQRLDQIGNKAIGLLQTTLIWLPAFCALYLLVVYANKSRSSEPTGLRNLRADTTTQALFIGLITANLIVNNPISSPRYRFGGVALALFAVVWSLRKPNHLRLWGGGLLVAILFALPTLDIFRYDDRQIELVPLKQQLLTSPDFGMFQQELNAQVYVATHGYTLGEQALGVIFGYVPRALWPDKPIDTGNIIVRSDAINASASLWATVYVDGGILAVAAIFFAYGRLTQLFENIYIRNGRKSLFVYAGVPLYAGFQIILLRGDLQPAIGQLAPLLVMLLIASRREAAGPLAAAGHAAGSSTQRSAPRLSC